MSKRAISQWAADFETSSNKILLTTYVQWKRGKDYINTRVRYFYQGDVEAPFWKMLDDMVDDVNPHNKPLLHEPIVIIWFLNSKKFDGEFIKHELSQHQFVNDFDLEENNTFDVLSLGQSGDILISFKYRNTKFLIKDILCFTPMTLKQMGQIVNLPKLDYDFSIDPTQFTPAQLDTYINYGCNDTLILAKYLKLFDKEADLNYKKITAPSATLQAFNKYLWGKMKKNDEAREFKSLIKIPLDQWSKKSYLGGYVCANPKYLNKLVYAENIYYYDVNSEYPYAMTQGVAYKKIGETKRENITTTKKRTYLVHVIIKAANLKPDKQPILREVVKGAPTSTYIIGNENYLKTMKQPTEYHYWLDEWNIIKDHYELEYTFLKAEEFELTYIFKEFIRKLYAKRKHNKQKFKETGEVQYYIAEQHCKLMLNSLYGKFGQSPVKEKSYYCEDNYSKDNVIMVKDQYYQVTSKQLIKYGNYHSYKIIALQAPEYSYNIYVASHITSIARCLLYSYIDSIPHEHFLYSDTDSIITTVPITKNIGLELGQLKREYDQHQYHYFYCTRPKNYIITKDIIINKDTDKVTISGVNNTEDIHERNLAELLKEGYTSQQKRAATIVGGKMITIKPVNIIKPNENLEIVNLWNTSKN